tara:strand:+ start:2117 stop:2764 length:648 start_codon:yes stop_codon:yes gene_type:complete
MEEFNYESEFANFINIVEIGLFGFGTNNPAGPTFNIFGITKQNEKEYSLTYVYFHPLNLFVENLNQYTFNDFSTEHILPPFLTQVQNDIQIYLNKNRENYSYPDFILENEIFLEKELKNSRNKTIVKILENAEGTNLIPALFDFEEKTKKDIEDNKTLIKQLTSISECQSQLMFFQNNWISSIEFMSENSSFSRFTMSAPNALGIIAGLFPKMKD